jgi:DNA polymerase
VRHATLDAETYSEAGCVWNPAAGRWESLPGLSAQKRGLKGVGADVYTAHPTFRPLSFVFDLHDGAGRERLECRSLTAVYPCPPRLAAWVRAGGIVEAWNAGFDLHYVWLWCVRNWGWPELPLIQQRCAMAKSRAAGYPGALDDAAAVLGTPRKDPAGHKLVRELTMPRKPTKANPALRWTPETAPEQFAALYAYNEQDVVSEAAASAALPELTPYELDVWHFDQVCNRRGMRLDMPAVENCIVILEQAAERANAELQRLTVWSVEMIEFTNGKTKPARDKHPPKWVELRRYWINEPAVSEYTEVAAMIRWCASRGVYFDTLDEEALEEALNHRAVPLPPDIARVLRIRQELAFGSLKKLYAMRAQVGADGRAREQYSYHGAHTSLWNGHGIQPANLYKGIFEGVEGQAAVEVALKVIACRSIELIEYEYGPGSPWAVKHDAADPLEVVASCLRSLIIASPGCRLISADFNAIQAVVTSALAREEWRLEVFRTHGRIYEAQASLLTGTPLDEMIEYKKRTGHHHPERQNPGKLAVLSGDFGAWIAGWKRFGADKLLGSDENIKRAILKTRASIPNIVELWGGQTRDRFTPDERPECYGLEGAAVKALKEPGQAYSYGDTVFQMVGTDLLCQTIDGGVERYHHAKLGPVTRSWQRDWEYSITYEGQNSNAAKGAQGWETMYLYGGVLTQNVVSRVARNVQAPALLRLEAAGYPIVMHTHDENVSDVRNEFGSAAEHTALTAQLPAWAKTPDGKPWPIKVPPSWTGQRYGKWD